MRACFPLAPLLHPRAAVEHTATSTLADMYPPRVSHRLRARRSNLLTPAAAALACFLMVVHTPQLQSGTHDAPRLPRPRPQAPSRWPPRCRRICPRRPRSRWVAPPTVVALAVVVVAVAVAPEAEAVRRRPHVGRPWGAVAGRTTPVIFLHPRTAASVRACLSPPPSWACCVAVLGEGGHNTHKTPAVGASAPVVAASAPVPVVVASALAVDVAVLARGRVHETGMPAQFLISTWRCAHWILPDPRVSVTQTLLWCAHVST